MTNRIGRILTVLRKIYGPDRPSFFGSPHEGEVLDDGEIILHELAHQTLMPARFVFSPGHMANDYDTVSDYIDKLPRYQRDLHELRAISIELLVAKRLQLPLRRTSVTRAGFHNTALFKNLPITPGDECRGENRFTDAVARAQRTSKVQLRADIIMYLIEETRKGSRARKTVQRAKT